MNLYAGLRAAAVCLLLAACASMEEKPPPAAEPEPAPAAPAPPPASEPEPPAVSEPEPLPQPVVAPEPPAVMRALHYFSVLKQRTAREQRLEQERLRKSFAATRSDHDRMRLALALSVPGASIAEESQALELLEPLVRDPRSDYHELATLVSGFLAEQRRRGEQAAALQTKLERIKALEKEMQQRSTAREQRPR